LVEPVEGGGDVVAPGPVAGQAGDPPMAGGQELPGRGERGSRRRPGPQTRSCWSVRASASRPADPARSPARSGSGPCGAGGDSAGRWPGRPGCGPRYGPTAGAGVRAWRPAGWRWWWRNRQAACPPPGQPQLSPRVRPFLPDDQPHALWSAVQDAAGEFGSFWLASGVDPAECARRAGQSIQVLFRYYAKFLAGTLAVGLAGEAVHAGTASPSVSSRIRGGRHEAGSFQSPVCG
jgi:hypothetical protein